MSARVVGLLLLAVLVAFLVPQRAFTVNEREWDWTYQDPISTWEVWDGTYPERVGIDVSPRDALADVPLSEVRVYGLRPYQRVGVRAWTWDKHGEPWAVAGVWAADEHGVVDLARQAPLSALFSEPDPNEFLVHMRPLTDKKHAYFAPSEVYTVHIQVEAAGRVLARTQVVRRRVANDVTCTPVRQPQATGLLCRPRGDGPFPGILVLGGSEGGIPVEWAKWWASHGAVALGLAYFGVEPLPEKLVHVPLEYFVDGLEWLRSRPFVDSDRVYVWGVSRGSEAAFFTAIYAPRVAGVIALAPSSVVWCGLDFSRGPRSAWTYKGRPLPFLMPTITADMAWVLAGAHVPLRDEYERSLNRAPQATFIPVERMRAPVLLVAGAADLLWPSDRMARDIVARLRSHRYPYPVRAIIVEEAGHTFLPFIEPPFDTVVNPAIALGGTREGNARLMQEGTRAMLSMVFGSP